MLFLQKTNKRQQNVTFQIQSFNNDLLQKILESKYITSHIYTLEYIQNRGETSFFLTTPVYDQAYNLTKIENKLINLDYSYDCYEFIQEKPYFLPIKITQTLDIFNLLNQMRHSFVYLQILLQKLNGNWRDKTISLYEDYAEGNEEPSYNFIVRQLQKGIIKLTNKLTNDKYKNSYFEEIDHKILQSNYRFECRILTDDKTLPIKVSNKLSELTFFNNILLQPANSLIIKEKSFQIEYENQIFSYDEIFTLLGCESNKEVEQAKIKNIQQEETLKLSNSNVSFLFSIDKRSQDDSLNETLINQLKHSFKRNKITDKPIKILSTFQGVTLNKITIEIPKDIVFSKIESNLKNIQATLGNKEISVEIGDIPDTVNFFLPRKKRDILYFRQLLDSNEFQEFKKWNILPIILGEDTNGTYLFACLQTLKHLLIAGATGGGKTIFIYNLIISLLINVPQHLLKMILIDPKKVELLSFEGFPQVKEIVTNMNESVDTLKELVEEVEKRYTIFSEVGVRNIKRYNEIVKHPLPYIVCVIDEYADLIETNKEVEDYIVRLGQKSRAAGIHLIIATQKPLVDVVTSSLKSNLTSVIGFRMKDHNSYMTVFGKSIPYRLLGNGDGVAMLEGNVREFIRFQSPIISLNEQEVDDVIKNLKEILKNRNEYSNEPFVKPIEKIKLYIAQTGETRLAKIREHMQIRMSDVGDLVSQLVKEGWLEKDGKGYKIIASNEELNKWR